MCFPGPDVSRASFRVDLWGKAIQVPMLSDPVTPAGRRCVREAIRAERDGDGDATATSRGDPVESAGCAAAVMTALSCRRESSRREERLRCRCACNPC